MPKEQISTSEESIEIDLRNPLWAAFWAWFLPGAGHLYQRRYAKGVLFMVCILSAYFFGLGLGKGHVVYASWTKNDKRWQYFCQVGVGVSALPALIQSQRVKNDKEALWNGFMAPPSFVADSDDFLDLHRDQLAKWHHDLNTRFELGTLYTMIAGLLNVLAIYDAYAGPVIASPDEEKDKPPPDDKKKSTA